MSEGLTNRIAAFTDEDFGRLCKYECEYDISDPTSPRNTTLIDGFLGGKDDPVFLQDKLRERRTILVDIEAGLRGRGFAETDRLITDIRTILDVLDRGLQAELTKATGVHADHQNGSDIANIETKIWGPLISDAPVEIARCSAYVSTLKSGEKLLHYCDRLGLEYVPSPAQYEHEEYKASEVHRSDYVDLYQAVISDIYGLDGSVIVGAAGNIVASHGKLMIPDHPAYKMLPCESVLELLAHEIEVHLVTAANHNNDFSYLPISPNHLIREEGLALFFEYQVFGKQPQMSTRSHVEILAGEQLAGSEYRDFMEFFGEIHGDSQETIFRRYLRRKRMYDFDTAGVQHKDTAYDRGYHRIKEYLASGKEARNLWAAHVPLEVAVETRDEMIVPQFFAQYCVARMQVVEDFQGYMASHYEPFPGMKSLIKDIDTSKHEQVYKRFSHLFENR